MTEYRVVDRFDRAGDKQTPGPREQRQHRGVLQQMLDLDRLFVGDSLKLFAHAFDDPLSVGWTVQEIRIAERDVLRPGINLSADVLEHDVNGHRSKPSLVHRNDRAVPAQMLAT